MKKMLFAWIMVLVSSAALALPAPKDIEAAVKAGQFSQAETMLHEVIREKPGSAKAHYELGQVLAREGKASEARKELLEAQRIDPSLKFAKDPQHFNDLLTRLPNGTGTASKPPARSSNEERPLGSQAAPAGTSSFPWTFLILGIAILWAVWFMIRRAASAARTFPGGVAARNSAAAAGYGPGGPAYGQPGYGQPGYGQPGYGPGNVHQPGSGVGGAVLGGLAGMAAGYGLSRVLHDREDGQGHAAQNADNNGFVPIDQPTSSPDYGDFDTGSGDSSSWDDGGDSSSGSDNDW